MTTPPPPRPRALGVVAFAGAVASLVLGAAAITLAGWSISRALRFTDYPDLVQDTQAQLWESAGSLALSAAWLGAAWILHALIAAWALVQGIVAVAVGRGRAWGAAAIVVAAIAWLPLTWVTQEAVLAGLLGLVPFFG
ncbi:hypothetical protein [Microbacterium excoecariae]|uniref:hypothetical protein n=1 Tax=Microbacterium excoecariae TaxID=2715210 RepID=UPI00140958AD|nr:hypothetical protein [Microbacterium excoecariae]NHI17360.1 hypothetical protein [Microbacterium excoecariae]